jgi:hypothetical protein
MVDVVVMVSVLGIIVISISVSVRAVVALNSDSEIFLLFN